LAWLTNISKALSGFTGQRSAAPSQNVGSASEVIDPSGYPQSRERSYKLRGRQKYITYSDMVTNTVIVAAGVRYFLNLIANAEWTFAPPEDEDGEPVPGAQEVADFVTDALNDMNTSWSKVVRRAARFRFQGFSIQEWTTKPREDGRLGFKSVSPRPCITIERWDVEDDELLGVVQVVSGRRDVYIPRAKFMYLVDDVLEDGPEGTGLLRHLVRSSERLKGYEDLEELAFETDLRGVPIGRAPLREMRDAVKANTMTVDDVRKARSAVDNFVKNKLLNKNKGIILDSETYNAKNVDGGTAPSATPKWDVSTVQSEAKAQADAANAINRVNREMAQLLGIEHLLLGSDGTGSLALIGGKLSSLFLVISSTNGEIAEAVDRDLIGPLCELNGIPRELWPKAKPQEIDVNDVEAVAQVLSSLATAGAPLMPNDPAIDAVRSRVGLPPAPEAPELSEEDMALVARTRAGLPMPMDHPDNPLNPANQPDLSTDEGPKPKPKPRGKSKPSPASKLLKALLQTPPEDD
jgi:hypothetical protein